MAEGRRCFRRRAAAAATTGQPACGHDLAGTPRLSIPGSVWLPDTGYGSLAPAMETYLRTNVARASGNDQARPLVVYCVRSCWMSWNAAKRILAMGYTEVMWYPDGTDGWSEANLPLQLSTPEPRPEQ